MITFAFSILAVTLVVFTIAMLVIAARDLHESKKAILTSYNPSAKAKLPNCIIAAEELRTSRVTEVEETDFVYTNPQQAKREPRQRRKR